MDKKKAQEILKGASQKELIGIICKMTACSREAEKILLSWGSRHADTKKELVYEAELQSLWDEAQEIISEFNEYGGGPDDEEETAADDLLRMSEIVKEHQIPWEIRKEILDGMLYEFAMGNSGFDDLLADISEDFCQTKEEIRYLADALSSGSSSYYGSYAAQLYRNIGDEDGFLQTRLANLNYGSDYVEAAEYFAEKGDYGKQMEYVWKGLKACRGRLDGLIEYAAPIYRKQKNEKELRRLYQFITARKWDSDTAAIARHLYEYAGEKGDYDSEKKMLLLLLKVCGTSDLKTWFARCRKELSEEDWKKEYPKILETIQKKDMKFYLDICMETGREAEVLKYLQAETAGYGFWGLDYGQYFSGRLFARYPEEILSLYWRDVHALLRVTNNKNYEMATGLLKKLKSCMKQAGKTQEWNRQFAELKELHKRKKNFMVMIQKL